jgi:DNA-binding NarL/FixJ family response regulator
MTSITRAAAGPVRVALVEDQPEVREQLARAIASDPTLQLLHAAVDASDILAWLATHTTDVLLVDLGLPDRSGLDVIRRCREWQPACEVMVVTLFGDEASMLQAFEAGARGYLLKDGSERTLALHVRQLAEGGSPMSPRIARQLLLRWQGGARGVVAHRRAGDDPPAVGESVLSARETQVLELVSRGYSYSEVARRMAVSTSTVQSHVRNIYGKLDVHSKAEAVFEARQLGLLP